MERRTWKSTLLLVLAVVLAGCGAAVQVAATPRSSAVAEATGPAGMTPMQDVSGLTPLESAALLQQVLDAQHIPVLGQAALELENIPQIPGLPNGCEITAATAVLQYLGFDADKTTMADRYLPTQSPYWEANPNVAFMGNPRDELAYYCLPGPVVTAVNAYLADVGDESTTAVDITGAGVEELEWYLTQGVPVLVWATRAFTEPLYAESFTLPDGSTPFANIHCLVLTGFDGDNLFFADPMLEITETDVDTFTLRYEQVGEHAVVILQA